MDKGKQMGRIGAWPLLWLAGLVLVVAATVFVLLRPFPKKPLKPPPGAAAPEAGEERLVGRWLRPDGGYVLEFREAGANGLLEAAYFNPRPINVEHAEWRRENGRLGVFVELRDANYPGSTYTLRYVPEQDVLAGDYFQAVHGMTFNVGFIRIR